MGVDEVKERVSGLSVGTKVLTFFVVLLILATLGACTFRATCVEFVDNYELGYRFYKAGPRAGQIEVLSHTGYALAIPFYTEVHTVDLRPMQVCITAIQRVLNCKLVQFNPAGLDLFLQWHGRADYDNNAPTQGGTSQFNDILKAYAYEGSGRSYPFLIIRNEVKPDQVPATPAPTPGGR